MGAHGWAMARSYSINFASNRRFAVPEWDLALRRDMAHGVEQPARGGGDLINGRHERLFVAF